MPSVNLIHNINTQKLHRVFEVKKIKMCILAKKEIRTSMKI